VSATRLDFFFSTRRMPTVSFLGLPYSRPAFGTRCSFRGFTKGLLALIAKDEIGIP